VNDDTRKGRGVASSALVLLIAATHEDLISLSESGNPGSVD
jgi:hypothetical protein